MRPLSRASLAFMVLAPTFAVAQFAGSLPVLSPYRPGYNAITIDDAKKYLGYLAGPETQGRGTGQPGYQKAADYFAARYKEFGLKPIGDNGTYFQHVPFWRSRFEWDKSYLELQGGAKFQAKGNFTLTSLTQNADVSGPVLFLRMKGREAKLPEGVDLKGKILVVASENTPRALRMQLSNAEPAAIMYVADKVIEPDWNVRSGKLNLERPAITPSGSISKDAAMRLARTLGLDDKALDLTAAEENTGTASASPTSIRLVAKGTWEDVMAPNVVGLLEGSDPTLKEEVVAIGCHLDHEGIKNGVVYPGADDDGSGSTALLLIAKAMATNPVKPKRSILFLAFTGEEMGLIGSRYYVDNPIIPIEKTQCLLQMDMVGRDSYGAQNGDQRRIDKVEENRDTMRLVGSKRISQELHDMIEDANRYVGFKFKYDAEDVYTRSDHYNFAAKGIPIAFQFCGFTPDYHQPTDTIEKINFDKIANAAKLFYLTAFAAGDLDRPLKRNDK